MNKIGSKLFENAKLSLRLAEKGEVCRMHRLTIQQVNLIDESVDYDAYCKRVDDISQALKIEGKMAVYNTQTKLDEILDEIKKIKDAIERLELMK